MQNTQIKQCLKMFELQIVLDSAESTGTKIKQCLKMFELQIVLDSAESTGTTVKGYHV